MNELTCLTRGKNCKQVMDIGRSDPHTVQASFRLVVDRPPGLFRAPFSTIALLLTLVTHFGCSMVCIIHPMRRHQSLRDRLWWGGVVIILPDSAFSCSSARPFSGT